MQREIETGEGEGEGERGEGTKYEKIKKFMVFFAKNHHYGAMWHATLASDACVARLEPP
jgi:hypothetical protein